MKTLRSALLGLLLASGLVSGADAHEPRVGVSVQFGYPVYYAPPPVRYAPPVYYVPPPVVYLPAPIVRPHRHADHFYRYDRGPYRGGHRHWRHNHYR